MESFPVPRRTVGMFGHWSSPSVHLTEEAPCKHKSVEMPNIPVLPPESEQRHQLNWRESRIRCRLGSERTSVRALCVGVPGDSHDRAPRLKTWHDTSVICSGTKFKHRRGVLLYQTLTRLLTRLPLHTHTNDPHAQTETMWHTLLPARIWMEAQCSAQSHHAPSVQSLKSEGGHLLLNYYCFTLSASCQWMPVRSIITANALCWGLDRDAAGLCCVELVLF